MGPADGPILTVNVGSSSLKLSVLDTADATVWARALDWAEGEALPTAELEEALAAAPGLLAGGHRVVHGADRFTGPATIDAEVEGAIEALADLAPLHNPRALAAIRALRALRPDLPAVACFDTAFHAGLPAEAATYAIPATWSSPYALRRYGFHGLSHAYASRRAAELLGRPVESLRVVTAHLGAGASLAAVAGGRSVDTTMGFTPLEGLVMATRSGSLDPGLLLWMQRAGGHDAAALERELDGEAGMLGLCGHADMRDVVELAHQGEEGCRTALDVYLHRLAAGIAAMAAAMNGLDALTFAGGVGEGSARVRRDACARLGFLGILPEPDSDPVPGSDTILSTGPAPVLLIRAREDVEIARQTRACLAAA
ncbi:MAG: acetate/propionate family kinase [Actinobacteria bacterium]|nr:acetate/propionate family kinase [Actinomycetota bacterium]